MKVGRPGRWLEVTLFAAAVLLLGAGNLRGWTGPAPYEPAPRVPGTLRIVTWNVGGGLAEGGSALRSEHLEHVARTLSELEPDLILLQELSSRGQLSEVRRALSTSGEWASALASGAGRRVGILARGAGLERFDVGAGEELDARRMLGVSFQAESGQEVLALVLHANAFSAEDRNREIGAALDSLLSAGKERPEALRFLAGDFNLDLDLDKRRDLFTNDSHLDVETYNYVTNSLIDAARGRGATAEPDRRLDYIFLGAEAVDVLAAGPWKGRRVGDMDHDPVVADIALGKQPE